MSTAVGPPVKGALWAKPDAARLLTVVGAGAAIVGISWFGASGQSEPGQQLIYVGLAAFGLYLGMAGVAGWLRGAWRTVKAEARRLLGEAPAAATRPAAGEGFVAFPDGRWFHRADCRLVKDRAVAVAARPVHEGAGRRPCPACVSIPTEVAV